MIPNVTEMMKAGLIEEMISDAIDSAVGGENEEEETEEEVQKVLDEIALDMTANLPAAQVRKTAGHGEGEGGVRYGETTGPPCSCLTAWESKEHQTQSAKVLASIPSALGQALAPDHAEPAVAKQHSNVSVC